MQAACNPRWPAEYTKAESSARRCFSIRKATLRSFPTFFSGAFLRRDLLRVFGKFRRWIHEPRSRFFESCEREGALENEPMLADVLTSTMNSQAARSQFCRHQLNMLYSLLIELVDSQPDSALHCQLRKPDRQTD